MLRRFAIVLVTAWDRLKKAITPKCEVCERNKSRPYDRDLHFSMQRKGDKLYLNINLMPFGYWTQADIQTFQRFMVKFYNGEFETVFFPRLRHDEPEPEGSNNENHF